MKKTFSSLLALILVIAAFVVLAPPAQAQVTPTALVGITNLAATVATASISNTTSYLVLNQGQGLALSSKMTVSSGTTAVPLQLYPTVDGTNYSSTVWNFWTPVSGATDVVGFTNWSAAQLAGIRAFKIGALTNANAGTLTNKGIIAGIPW